MKKSKDNPVTNALGSGVTEDKLDIAITKSGYPLQTKVALQLKKEFHVQEEWSFIDDKTKEIRTIDLLAEKWLIEFDETIRVRPILDLIIECKQAELPFVFFLTDEKLEIRNFPYIAGLSKDEIVLTTDNETSTWHYTLTSVLSLERDDFLSKDPTFCNKFSKCERRGDSLILSGEESFNGIVYPLLKAMRYFKNAEKPPSTAQYFDCHLILGVGVLDAPMVGVEITKDSHKSVLLPWVRVVKHETDAVPNFQHMMNMFAFDIVHKDFLGSYIANHVLPFAQHLSELILKHQEVLAANKGFVSNMEGVNYFELEKHLQRRPGGF